MSDLDFKIIKQLSKNPQVSQRELSNNFGVSLGKINFVIKALINKGLIKVSDFKNSKNKRAYAYHLTAKGISKKAQMTLYFLMAKTREYEKLQIEIEELKKDLDDK